MEAEVVLKFRYLESSEEGLSKLLINSETKTVWDLKLLIQENINAPACDQKVSFQGRQLQDASLPLTSLYLRDGDVIEVDAPVKINVPDLRQAVLELKRFRDRIRSGDNCFKDCNTELDLELVYENVQQSLCAITDRFFAPWNTERAAANRHFFVQDGGFSALVELLKYAQQNYSVSLSDDETLRSPEQTDTNKKVFKNHQQLQLMLQTGCLSLLWRFMVKPADRKYVVQNCGMKVILYGLMFEPEVHMGQQSFRRFNPMLRWRSVDVNHQALGCLAGCVEYDKHAQEIVAQDSAVIDKLLSLVCENSSNIWFFENHFYGLVAANTLFYLTFSSQALKKLADDRLYLKIIPLTEKFLDEGNIDDDDDDDDDDDVDGDDKDLLHLGYYLCLVLARMLASPLVTIDTSITVTINALIERYMEKLTPSTVALIEERQSYVWMTLVPLVHLAFAVGNVSYSEEGNIERQVSSIEPSSTATDLGVSSSAMIGVTTTEIPCETAEGSPRDPHPVVTGFLPNYDHTVSSMPSNVPVRESSNPGNQTCSAAANSEHPFGGPFAAPKCPGSWSVQRLGIFAIQHLLYSSANRQLLLAEDLLQYLICLSWQLQKEERVKLEQELNKFNDIKPPSLKAAATSILARLHGFETVFHTM